jgi:hypothetical protein
MILRKRLRVIGKVVFEVCVLRITPPLIAHLLQQVACFGLDSRMDVEVGDR